MASSIDSTDSYNGDDAWCFLHERDKVLGHHWEATQENERREAALVASQTSLATVEGESSAVQAGLADFDARVAGRFPQKQLYIHYLASSCFS